MDHSAHRCLSPCIHDVGLKSSANDQSVTEEHGDGERLIGRVRERERRSRVQKCEANLKIQRVSLHDYSPSTKCFY